MKGDQIDTPLLPEKLPSKSPVLLGLTYKQLHLNRKDNSYLTNSFLDYLARVCKEQSLVVSKSRDGFTKKVLHSLRKQYPQNTIISYLNINSIRNKFNVLKLLVSDSVDVLCIVEPRLVVL